MRLAPGEAGLSMARQFAVSVTESTGWHELVDDIAVVTSELATNAVLHGERPIRITVETSADRLRIEVTDAGPGMPVELDASPELETGRGLAIVAALAQDWGAERLPGSGKMIWAEVRHSA